MAEPTFTAIFGTNATQDATSFTISKTDLAAVGLTASTTNTAESLIAAMLALAQLSLGEVTYGTNTDQSITIVDDTDTLVTRGTTIYRQKSKTVSFYKPDTQGNFDPDDY